MTNLELKSIKVKTRIEKSKRSLKKDRHEAAHAQKQSQSFAPTPVDSLVPTGVTIFRLIIHYELQNEAFYPYLLRSSYRTISKLHFNPRILATLISGLKILFNATDRKKIEQALKQIRQDLTPLLSYSDFRGWLNYFDITQWLDSKIHNVSFAEIMHKEAMKRRAKPIK